MYHLRFDMRALAHRPACESGRAAGIATETHRRPGGIDLHQHSMRLSIQAHSSNAGQYREQEAMKAMTKLAVI
jgi:hypothetical protein